MKDKMDKLASSQNEKLHKLQQKMELKHTLEQQIKDNANKKMQDKRMTEKEFYLNKPILQKMASGQIVSEADQDKIVY